MKNYLILSILLFIIMPSSIWAEDYRQFLTPGTTVVYKHWNVKKKKITGYSNFEYREKEEGGKSYLVEYQVNTKPSGKEFTTKELLFDASTGNVAKYWEKDLRKDFEIENIYKGKKIKTTLSDKGDKEKMEQRREKGLVPIEILPLYLRRYVGKDNFKKKRKFTLYIPVAPGKTWDYIAERKKKLTADSPFGKVPAIEVLLKPNSFFLKALPEEKTHFRFTIATEAPYHVLKVAEGETHLILEKVEKP